MKDLLARVSFYVIISVLPEGENQFQNKDKMPEESRGKCLKRENNMSIVENQQIKTLRSQ